MRAINNFLPLPLSTKLKKLGVSQDTAFFWIRPNHQEIHVLGSVYHTESIKSVVLHHKTNVFDLGDDEYSAFTAEELLDLMPKRLRIGKQQYAPLFIEKNEWIGHTDAYRCFYLSNSFGIRSKAGSKTKTEERILATILIEAQGHTLVIALANLYAKIITEGYITLNK